MNGSAPLCSVAITRRPWRLQQRRVASIRQKRQQLQAVRRYGARPSLRVWVRMILGSAAIGAVLTLAVVHTLGWCPP